MRLGRILKIATLAVWLTAVPYYWWYFVPPSPTHIIPLEGRSHRWTPGLGEVIVLSQNGEGELRYTGPNGERRPPAFGPLQFYDPATGQKVREVLTEDDEILALSLGPREVAIVHKDGVISAVDLSHPDKPLELPDTNPNSQFVFASGGRVVITHLGRGTTFDLTTGARTPPAARIVGALKGAIAASADERLYATVGTTHVFIYDAATDNEISRVPLSLPGRYPPLVKFSPDGADVMVLEDIDRHQRRLTIWDSQTGRQRTRPSSPIPHGPVSRHGAWSISNDNPVSLIGLIVEKLPARWTSRLQRSAFFWNVMMKTDVAKSHLIILTDTATGQTLGRYQIPTTAEWLLVADDQHGAVAFGEFNAIHCYNVPANRNWLWLVKWGAMPIAAVWGLLSLFRKWRLHRRVSRTPATPAP